MSGGRVEAAGVELAYTERGSGQPVVLVHGTAGARSTWDETVTELGDGLRAIAYDRRAYGESGAPEPYGGTTVGEQADDLAALVDSPAPAPAVVCGHSLGAIVCLDLLVRRPELARGAALVEPPMYWLLRDGAEVVSEIRDAVERGAREGSGAGAVTAFLEAVGGAAALGEERIAAARQAPRGFAADLGAAASWSAGRRELRSIERPVTLVVGTRGSRPEAEATRALAGMIPVARLVELDGGHWLPVDAPAPLAGEIRALAQ